jgi:sulfite oxidase
MWGKRPDMAVHQAEPYNAEPAPHVLAAQHLTPVEAFYSRNHGPVPEIDPRAWRLQVQGLVDQPLEVGLADLQGEFAQHTLEATLQCAGNRRTGLSAVRAVPGEPWGSCATSTASWTGVRLGDVLRAAGVRDGTGHVELSAPDLSDHADPPQTYASSIPVAKALADEVLLAWGMNGRDLPAVHGGPVRAVVPGYIGARSVKWVQRVTARRDPCQGYFQSTAYRLLPPEGEPAPGAGVPLGPVALNADVLVPADGSTLAAGTTEVSGYAYAGDDRGIVRVDVSVDGGGTWVQAELDDRAGPWTWRLWRTRVALAEGRTEISVRAWDTTAATQPERPEAVWNPQGYVNNSWGRVAVTAVR